MLSLSKTLDLIMFVTFIGVNLKYLIDEKIILMKHVSDIGLCKQWTIIRYWILTFWPSTLYHIGFYNY